MTKGSNFTPEQEEAVSEDGGQLLVAAAAGSGKTKVLVERLFKQMMGPEFQGVNKFLVITFTRDAAGELKQRIAQRIKEEIEMIQGQGVNEVNLRQIRHLQQQISMLPQANVSTIHGFCGNLIREHGHTLGINPGFRQITQEDGKVIENEILNLTLNHWYQMASEGNAPDFLEMVDFFSWGRKDDKLATLILDIYGTVQSEAKPRAWLEYQKKMWEFKENTEISSLLWGKYSLALILPALENGLKAVKKLLRDCMDPPLRKSQGESLDELEGNLQGLLLAVEGCFVENPTHTWDDVVGAFDFKNKRAGSSRGFTEEEKEINSKINEKRKKIYENVMEYKIAQKNQEVLQDLREISPHMLCLLDVILSFDEWFRREKTRRNILDFGDLEHIAVELLVDHEGKTTALAKSVSEQFVEIMVDEYQDTNQVQNAIFSAISQRNQGGKEKNLFFVGDVKQSIYSFRLADPSIFVDHFTNFSKTKGVYPRALLLTRNFRSRKEVLDGCNDFFKAVMTPDFGGTDYARDGMLVCGGTFPDYASEDASLGEREKCCPYHVELDVLDGKNYDTTHLPGERHHLEAYWVAQRVKDLIDSKFQVSAEKGGGFRDVEYSDILILLRSYKNVAQYYEEAMEELGIPFKAPQGGDIFSYLEVEIALSFLRIVDNPLQEVSLVSVLRSPLFDFTADELTLLRQGSEGNFYQAVLDFSGDFCVMTQKIKKSEGASEDSTLFTEGEGVCRHPSCIHMREKLAPALIEKRNRFLALLKKCRQGSWEMTAQELLWYIMEESNMMGIFGGMEDGTQRQERLLEFYRIVGQLAGEGKTLFSALSQFDALKEVGELPQGHISQREEDVVELKSIHKAKGLEKPVVLVAGLSKRYQTASLQAPMLIHSEYGLGPKLWKEGFRSLHSTQPRKLIKQVKNRDLVSEELRLLYVAMTRAKEKLILSVSLSDGEKKLNTLCQKISKPLLPSQLERENNMGDVVLSYALTRPEGEVLWQKTLDGSRGGMDVDPNFSSGEESRWNISWVDCGAVIESVEDKLKKREEKNILSSCGSLEEETVNLAHENHMSELKKLCEKRYEWQYSFKKEGEIPSKFTATQIKGRVLVSEVQEGADISTVTLSDDFSRNFMEELLETMGESPEKFANNYENIEGEKVVGDAPPELTLAERKAMDRQPSFMQKKKSKLSPTQRGNAIHLVMQYLDIPNLKNADLHEIDKKLQQLVEENKITPLQKSVIHGEKIMAFLPSPWGEAACGAQTCKQEFKFSILVSGNSFEYATEEMMLLQGVVDCWYEEVPGELVVIDFKSDRVPMGIPGILDKKAKDHQKQMDVYALALEEMTGKKVTKKVLWFFEANCGVEVEDGPLAKK